MIEIRKIDSDGTTVVELFGHEVRSYPDEEAILEVLAGLPPGNETLWRLAATALVALDRSSRMLRDRDGSDPSSTTGDESSPDGKGIVPRATEGEILARLDLGQVVETRPKRLGDGRIRLTPAIGFDEIADDTIVELRRQGWLRTLYASRRTEPGEPLAGEQVEGISVEGRTALARFREQGLDLVLENPLTLFAGRPPHPLGRDAPTDEAAVTVDRVRETIDLIIAQTNAKPEELRIEAHPADLKPVIDELLALTGLAPSTLPPPSDPDVPAGKIEDVEIYADATCPRGQIFVRRKLEG